MKKYVSPTLEIIHIETLEMIAVSGDETTVTLSETEYSGTFNSRGNIDVWGDDEETEE